MLLLFNFVSGILEPRSVGGGIIVLLVVTAVTATSGQQDPPLRGTQDDAFRFRSGVELINVTATVSDASGRFVPGLRQEDFTVFEDDQPVEITHFSAERVPVSLGIAIDTSGSMAGEKMREAQNALERFAYDLLDKDDEVFVYRFSNYPALVQGWTTDRQVIARALGRLSASGGTAMYDAVVEALPLVAQGRNQKKALVVISDGNDTASRNGIRDVRQQIRESEALVYAVGIDGEPESYTRPQQPFPPRFPIPFPPPRGRGRFPLGGGLPQLLGAQRTGTWSLPNDDRVNVAALRSMTDESGGRTEIIRNGRDLDPATAGIADELSKQYYLGYRSLGKKDGQWHAIKVHVMNPTYRVRARRGYTAN